MRIHTLTHGSNVNLRQFCLVLLCILSGQRHDEAVFTNGKADSGSFGAAERLRQSVIPSTAQDRILRAQIAVREFKSRSRVVVKATHQPVIQSEGDSTS